MVLVSQRSLRADAVSSGFQLKLLSLGVCLPCCLFSLQVEMLERLCLQVLFSFVLHPSQNHSACFSSYLLSTGYGNGYGNGYGTGESIPSAVQGKLVLLNYRLNYRGGNKYVIP